ncbi:putative glycoside hydrolase family 31 protein [Eutypa lata UCREL1]|uniref:Putative glycoside hydrolase family 31 protein n=1 Tax=Eutypa lata (strain UCR-EL1) TaxID=1287681 RepID=M7TLN8_EUTLA|nr:putative glycoside hydrolase family 31 protein [Eutypa lata UCREL1]
MFLNPDKKTLEHHYDSQILRIEAWGPNAFRKPAHIRNGRATATVTRRGKLTIKDDKTGKLILEEFVRSRVDVKDPKASALRIEGREFRGRPGADSWHLMARFETAPVDEDDEGKEEEEEEEEERIYGMGQYQQPFLNLKGTDVELAQRNSQASIPFAVSSRGYGFLWNNPAVGRAVFGRNLTTFEAYSTRVLDYWIVLGDAPAEIVRAYTDVVGKAPEMPEYGLGFWQCKLRYQTQEEVLEVAREHKTKRGLPMDVIVVDYFHWPYEGEWKFDPTFWPDPDAMIAELKSLGIELMVSIWPTVDRRSENYAEMLEKGLLIRQDRGWRNMMEGDGNCVHFDATNPAARKYVWEKAKRHYFDKGVRIFWLDEAEPEYTHYDFDNYRYHGGPDLMIGNVFPAQYSRGFYEGQRAAGQDKVVNLVRCCWAGSQKYGALLWSGDIASSWSSLRSQVAAGLNAGLAGIAWWTTDIGGFHGGDPRDPGFRELFTRWFQWGAWCPVFRLHGDREPKQPRHGTTGGSYCLSGAANEVWSYGDEIYGICKTYLLLREKLRDYVRSVMDEAHVHGDPVIRPLFYEFPTEKAMWAIEDQYMFGSKYLVAPILKAGQRDRKVVLPGGANWQQLTAEGELAGDVLEGGRSVTVAAPLEYTPVFERQ